MDRDCESCKHRKKEVCKDGIFYYSCDLWDCEFEPCEPVENPDQLDCISRQAVLDTLERMDKALDEDRTVENYKELLRECYKVLPSVSSSEKLIVKKSRGLVKDLVKASPTESEV